MKGWAERMRGRFRLPGEERVSHGNERHSMRNTANDTVIVTHQGEMAATLGVNIA